MFRDIADHPPWRGRRDCIITQTIVKVTVFSSSFIILLKYVLFSSKPLRNYPFLGEVISLRARLKTRGNMILVQSDGAHPNNHLSTTREFLSLLSTNSTHNEWKRSTIEAWQRSGQQIATSGYYLWWNFRLCNGIVGSFLKGNEWRPWDCLRGEYF